MKIALLNNGYGTVERGSEHYTHEIYKLLKNDYTIDIYGTGKTDHSIQIRTPTRFELRAPTRNMRAYREAHYFCKEFAKLSLSYDLILNNAGFVGSRWCNIIRERTGIPFVTFERGGGREERLNHRYHPDIISYLTDYSYKKSKYYSKVHLPIGIDVATYKYNQTTDFEEFERPLFLSTSALVKFKRVDRIIRAVHEYGEGTLVQTSNGNMRQKLCKLGERLLGSNFVFTGIVRDDVLKSLYASSDLYLSASGHEAFGMVYLEAMASGTPVVAHMDERRKEIVGVGGHLVDFDNLISVTRNMREIIMSNNCHPIEQAKKFDWKVLKQRYIDMIENFRVGR